MQPLTTQRIEEMQRLTRAYAKFGQRCNGLGNVLGGLAGLIAYLVGGFYGAGAVTALVTIGLTIAWLVGKQMIRARLYRSFGEARERWPKWRVAVQVVLVVYVSGFVAAVLLFCWKMGGFSEPRFWPYVIFTAAVPWVVWRYLRTWYEFFIGVFLLCACAVTSGGGAYSLADSGYVVLFAGVMILIGMIEHFRYRKLAERLAASRGAIS